LKIGKYVANILVDGHLGYSFEVLVPLIMSTTKMWERNYETFQWILTILSDHVFHKCTCAANGLV